VEAEKRLKRAVSIAETTQSAPRAASAEGSKSTKSTSSPKTARTSGIQILLDGQIGSAVPEQERPDSTLYSLTCGQVAPVPGIWGPGRLRTSTSKKKPTV